MDGTEKKFIKSLSISPNLRTLENLLCIRSYLETIEALKSYPEISISDLARIARYEHHNADVRLYKKGDSYASWYVILSGCVWIGKTIFFPRNSFGNKSSDSIYRSDECIILEESELIVFDYNVRSKSQDELLIPGKNCISLDTSGDSIDIPANNSFMFNFSEPINKNSSRSSDSSSMLSGIDRAHSPFSNVYYASDEEDDPEDDSLYKNISSVNDTLIDIIRKDPEKRSERDIEIIFDAVLHLSSLTNLTLRTKYELCRVMRLISVNNAGEKIMEDGNVLETWNIIIDGSIEIRFKDGSVKEYSRGNSFGVMPCFERQRQKGDIWTTSLGCLFFCVSQKDFCEIISRNTETIIPEMEDDGRIVLEYEGRNDFTTYSTQTNRVIVRGTKEKLLDSLLQDQSGTDNLYVQNLLLTYRVFINSPKILAEKLYQWYNSDVHCIDTKRKDMIRKCLLLWSKNHFGDFDDPDAEMNEYLEKFENMLSDEEYSDEDRMSFLITCSNMSKKRSLHIFIKMHYMKKLPFRLLGLQRGWGLFICEVSDFAYRSSGLRRGDQILSLNNQSWENIESIEKATNIISSLELSSIDFEVKYNPVGLHNMLISLAKAEEDKEPLDKMFSVLKCSRHKSIHRVTSRKVRKRSGSVTLHSITDCNINNDDSEITPMAVPSPEILRTKIRSTNSSPTRGMTRPKSKIHYSTVRDVILHSSGHLDHFKTRSSSIFDMNLSIMDSSSNESNKLFDDVKVLKVYRASSTNGKLVLISSNSTVKEALVSILKAFQINPAEIDLYRLYLVSVTSGNAAPIISSKCMGTFVKDLTGLLEINQRYYLKHFKSDLQLITDDQAKAFLTDIKVTINDLTEFDIATRLTMFDYESFRNIQPEEYINFIFMLPHLKEKKGKPSSVHISCSKMEGTTKNSVGFSTGCSNYNLFQDLINRESNWPATEICSEPTVTKRAELIKKFIKIAKICKDLKNFNSFMCIMFGLNLSPVERLKASWEKVPSKYLKIYEELNFFTNMSFNFRNIRKLVSAEMCEPPLIPYLAIHSKDLAVIHLCNETNITDELINLEKLRMMASEINKLVSMCNVNYNLSNIMSTMEMHSSKSLFTMSSSSTTTNNKSEVDDSSFLSSCSTLSEHPTTRCRTKSIGQITHKCIPKKALKIYEEWLTTLKVKTYLSNLAVKSNINELQDLSKKVEPPISQNSSSSESLLEQMSHATKMVPRIFNLTKSPVTVSVTPSITPSRIQPQMKGTVPSSAIRQHQPGKERPQSIFDNHNEEELIYLLNSIKSTKKNLRVRSMKPIVELQNPKNGSAENICTHLQIITPKSNSKLNGINDLSTLSLSSGSDLSNDVLEKAISEKEFSLFKSEDLPLDFRDSSNRHIIPVLSENGDDTITSQHRKIIAQFESLQVNNASAGPKIPISGKSPQSSPGSQYLKFINNQNNVTKPQIGTPKIPSPPPRTVSRSKFY